MYGCQQSYGRETGDISQTPKMRGEKYDCVGVSPNVRPLGLGPLGTRKDRPLGPFSEKDRDHAILSCTLYTSQNGVQRDFRAATSIIN